MSGLQGALWELGSVPEVVGTDSLSVATHDLRDSGGRAFNESYRAILDHYGLKATRTNPRSFARERSRGAGAPPPEGRHSVGPGSQGQPRLRVGSGVHGLHQADRRQAQQAYQGEVGARVPAPARATAGSSARVRQLPHQGAQVEHHQSVQQDILGAVAPDRCGGHARETQLSNQPVLERPCRPLYTTLHLR